MTPRRLITVPMLLALLACQGPAPVTMSESKAPTQPQATAPATPKVPVVSQPTEPEVAEAPDPEAIKQAFAGAGFVKINEAPVEGTSAHPGPIDLYVDKAHAAVYRPGFTGLAPVGTTVVKVSTDGDFVAIMQKLPAGSDPGAKDWYFYEDIGSEVVFDGNKTKGGGLCFNCHKSGAETDYLLGLDVFTE